MMWNPASPSRRGVLIVLSSPSGAGKSTLAQLLLKDDPNLSLSISVTTRARRTSEIDGEHYHFISVDDFDQLESNDALLEFAQVHGNKYGTPRAPVEAALAEGKDILFDIDWQGTEQLAQRMPADLVRIFILPPSMRELKSRLERRAEDSAKTIANRLRGACEEISKWDGYDYVVVNTDIAEALGDVKKIIDVERMRRVRAIGLEQFVTDLLEEAEEINAA